MEQIDNGQSLCVMELRWRAEAASDLECIADYLFEHTPGRAPRLVLQSPATLPLNRSGSLVADERVKKAGIRKLVPATLPYILIYRVTAEGVQIILIRHGAEM